MIYLSEIRLSTEKAYRWGRRIGIGSFDEAYLAHSVLAACYGEYYPKPFVIASSGRSIRVLGYTRVDGANLERARQIGSDPEVNEIVISETSKKMPSDWRAGETLGFRLKATPVRRVRGKDRDAYQAGIHEPGTRYERYMDWLVERLSPTCKIVSVEVENFKFEKILRRKHDTSRSATPITVPSATFVGALTITNPAGFNNAISNGIGRHKAFGYGALLLRPH